MTTYAAQPEPEKKPWRKRPSLLDQAFQAEIEKEEKRQAELIPEQDDGPGMR